MRRRRFLPAALVLALAGCTSGDGPADREPAGRAGAGEPVIVAPGEGLRAPIDVIPHTILPRRVEQDYVELLRRTEVGPVCAMLVRPVVRTPREGPWTITLVTPNGDTAARLPAQRLDPVTGQITLVAHTPFFGPGEWTIELDLVEGGITHGPERQVFRFRVE